MSLGLCDFTGMVYLIVLTSIRDQSFIIPINDISFEQSVFWLSDTESRINKLRFSDSVSLAFKTRLKSVSCFCGDVT